MPPKQAQKGKQTTGIYKTAALAKDVLPASVKNPPREGKPVKIPDVQSSQIERTVYFQPCDNPEDWPGDEAAKNFDFGLTSNNVFNDPQQFKLPESFQQSMGQVIWRRPAEFFRLQEEEISMIQNKYNHHRRNSYSQLSASSDADFANNQYRGSTDDLNVSLHNTKKQQQQQQALQQQNNEVDDPDASTIQPEEIILKIFNTFDREETPEEFELRKKEIQEKAQDKKGSKKAGKTKEEPVDEAPIKVKDVKLSNIDMAYKYPEDSKWIASQLQVIKDRKITDIYNGKQIWTKVYPQQDGVPVYNPAGRYWVKLYYMGKERKIEIDDKMPVSLRGTSKFPRSVNKGEIWPCILAKAIIKLMSITENFDKDYNLIGSGQILYSLTGMLSQTFQMSKNMTQNKEIFQQIREYLNDQHFTNSDVFVTCFCNPNFNPVSDTNTKRSTKDYYIDKARHIVGVEEQDEDDPLPKSKQNNNNSNDEEEKKQDSNTYNSHAFQGSLQQALFIDPQQPVLKEEALHQTDSVNRLSAALGTHAPKIVLSPHGPQQQQQQQFFTSNVTTSFAYSIVESFFNENFNMIFVQKRSDTEIRLRQDYFEMSKISMHKMSKDDKLEYRRKKKEIREKIQDEDRKRIEFITKPPIQYRFFRLKTGVKRLPRITIMNTFNQEEIQIAKQCIINRLSKPPNYELPEIRDDGKSVISSAVRNPDESFVMKPLDDFSAVPNLKEPMRRVGGGAWLLDTDLVGCFQQFQVFYNQTKLPQQKIIQISASADSEITQNTDNELLIIEKNDENILKPEDPLRLLFGFMAKQAKNEKIRPPPYSILQKFDFGSFEAGFSYPQLQDKLLAQMISHENKNSVFRILTYSPLAYTLFFASDGRIKSLSIFDYLTQYEGYKLKNFPIECPAMEAKKYQCFFKFRIPPVPQAGSFFFLRVKSNVDSNVLKYFRLKVMEEPDQPMMLSTIQGVHKNLFENSFIIQPFIRLAIKQGIKYYLILEGVPPYNVQEGQLDVDFFFKEEIPIELMEAVEPLEYCDRYIPYKYGTIFREKLYVSEATIASFHLRMAEAESGGAQQQTMVAAQKPGGAKKAGGQDQPEIVEKEMSAKRLIKIELFEGNKCIQYAYGQNWALLSHVALLPNKLDESKVYYLQASFDLQEWPNCKTENPETDRIYWFLKVLSSDTVVIVRDTEKEDKEKAIIKNWEDKELGRSEKAKKSRKKYQILQKKARGENLTEEENNLINEQRLSKKQRDEEAANVKQPGQKGKAAQPPQKKDDKKAGKGGKKEELIEEKKEERPIPVSTNHTAKEIQEFLEHMEDDRVHDQLARHAGLICTRSEENQREIKEGALMSGEDLTAMFTKNMQLREEVKLYQRDLKQVVLNDLDVSRKEYKTKWQQYLETRDQIKGKIAQLAQKERELLDICRQEKPVISPEDFDKLIQQALSIPEINNQIIDLSRKVLKNIKLQALSDKIVKTMEVFDIDGLQACMDEITKTSAQGIDTELIEKAESMLEEAKENPNFVAEKQAEAKKAGKKGKK